MVTPPAAPIAGPKSGSARKALSMRSVYRAAVAAVVSLAALAGASHARAGQIVYAHGHDLWAIGDDGSAPRPLLSAAQAGGPIGLAAPGDNGIGVIPDGNTIALDVRVPAPDGSCVQNCPGLYTLAAGGLTRLSAPTARCPTTARCASQQVDPAVTADGRVVYLSLAMSSPPDCGGVYCLDNGGYIEQYYSRALDGHDAPALWPLPALGPSDPAGVQPDFHGALAADPADPTQIAYTGNYVQGQDVRHNGGCGPQGLSDCFPLDVAASSGAVSQIRVDDGFYYGLAFSPDGSLVAGLETGDNKGIWVYPSAQSYTAATPPPSYAFALADPATAASGAGPLSLAFSGLTFADAGAVVFSAMNNLWSLPARCWAAPSTTPACAFPADAVQLTHDGTAAAPDTQPAWTSSTTPIAADTTPAPIPAIPPIPPKPADPLTAVAVSPPTARSGRPPQLRFSLTAGAGVRVTVIRHVPAAGGGPRAGAHDVVARRLSVSGQAGVNRVSLARPGGRPLTPGRYRAIVSAGFRARTASFTVIR